jgi:hypothetical protein
MGPASLTWKTRGNPGKARSRFIARSESPVSGGPPRAPFGISKLSWVDIIMPDSGPKFLEPHGSNLLTATNKWS